MKESIRILRDEHRSIAAVLHGLQHLARKARDPKLRPEFEVFRAMIYYIDAFPEREHHPKEDKLLFARLEARAPQAKELLESLRAEHVLGAQLVRDLEQAVIAFEETWPKGGEAFEAAVERYADFHWKHMRTEENEVLPLAEQVFDAEDWKAVDEGFKVNADPIAGHEGEMDRLFSRIVSLAPEPIGLGRAWKKANV
jgi:hemerythrin-like domain-containing protein